jgi:small-conductance mechanosensitive channel
LLLASFTAHAQETQTDTPVEVPQNLTHEEVRDLVARLSDDEVRELIIRQLDKVAAEQAQAGEQHGYAEQVRLGIEQASTMLMRVLASKNRFRETYAEVWRQLTHDGDVSGWTLLLQLIGLIAIGWAAYRFTRYKLGQASEQPLEMPSLGKRFDLACYGAAMGLIEIGAFVVGAIVFVEVVTRDLPAAQFLWYQVIWYIALVWLVMLVTIRIMSPEAERIRLAAVSNEQARQVCLWVFILTAVLMLPLGSVIVEVTGDLEAALMLRISQSSLWVLLLIWVVFRLRHYGAGLIIGDTEPTSRFRQSFARVWWIIAILYIVMVYFMSIGKRLGTGESSLVPALFSLGLIAAIPYLNIGLKWLISYYYREKEADEVGTGPAVEAPASAALTPPAEAAIDAGPAETAETGEPAADSGPAEVVETTPASATATRGRPVTPHYQALAARYARVLMILAVVAIFLRLWNIDIEALAGTIIGERVATVLYEIGLTVLLSWALWGVIRIAIERKLADEKGDAGESEEAEAGGLGGSRVETVLPLIRASIKITIIVMATLLSLSALGINIGPLIAGAGVIGLAIGFGAQTLVRDVVSGFFYLLDDAFRIGEYVVIGDIRGTVEKISVRSFQLRHHNGPVHTIPYGDIATLTNYSRDWAIMKIELRLPFETDIEMVRKIIKKIGQEMMEDPQFGPLLLQPIKSQGVNRMDDSALIIRVKFMTIPGQQYLVRREVFTRIQRVFEEKGIHFAPKRVLVEATTPEDAIKAGAALAASEDPGASQKPVEDTP